MSCCSEMQVGCYRQFGAGHVGALLAAPLEIACYSHQCGALAEISNPYTASQGRELCRDGFVQVRVDDKGEVWIGGKTQTVVEGKVAWG